MSHDSYKLKVRNEKKTKQNRRRNLSRRNSILHFEMLLMMKMMFFSSLFLSLNHSTNCKFESIFILPSNFIHCIFNDVHSIHFLFLMVAVVLGVCHRLNNTTVIPLYYYYCLVDWFVDGLVELTIDFDLLMMTWWLDDDHYSTTNKRTNKKWCKLIWKEKREMLKRIKSKWMEILAYSAVAASCCFIE